MRAHQPGSTPIDIPETVPNPAYTPAPTPAPAPERAPTKVPEQVPEKVIAPDDSGAFCFRREYRAEPIKPTFPRSRPRGAQGRPPGHAVADSDGESTKEELRAVAEAYNQLHRIF